METYSPSICRSGCRRRCWIGDRTSGSVLLRDADVALYQAKAKGKNKYVFFDQKMEDAIGHRLPEPATESTALGPFYVSGSPEREYGARLDEIPAGYEAEYFSLYQACERGTSWFGTLLFGVVQQVTHSYRWAIIATCAAGVESACGYEKELSAAVESACALASPTNRVCT